MSPACRGYRQAADLCSQLFMRLSGRSASRRLGEPRLLPLAQVLRSLSVGRLSTACRGIPIGWESLAVEPLHVATAPYSRRDARIVLSMGSEMCNGVCLPVVPGRFGPKRRSLGIPSSSMMADTDRSGTPTSPVCHPSEVLP